MDSSLSGFAAKLLGRGVFGQVLPARPVSPVGLDREPRDHALLALQNFFSKVVCYRTAENSRLIPFRIPKSRIFIEQPDDIEGLRFPSISIIPARGARTEYGLGGPKPIEKTLDKFGKGTVLVQLAEYTEDLVVEVWGSKAPERRSVSAALTRAMRMDQTSYAIRLELPTYFGSIAQFSLGGSTRIDDSDVVRNRRREHLYVNMRVEELALVAANSLKPFVDVTIGDIGQIVLPTDAGCDCPGKI